MSVDDLIFSVFFFSVFSVSLWLKSPLSPRWSMTMQTLFLSLIVVGLALPVVAAELPAPERLPVHPELPDPLVALNGERITTKAAWREQRRPELKALFQ